MRKPLEDRFWAKVDKTETCWLWTGAKHNHGYGLIQKGVRGQGLIRATHLSWKLQFGQDIPKKVMLCHTCDNPACVNPAHLFLGDHKANARDMSTKGRWNNQFKFGQKAVAGPARLTVGQVRTILASKKSGSELAKVFGVAKSTINRIKSGKTWNWLKEVA